MKSSAGMATLFVGSDGPPAVFSDDFERADGAVGNGWVGSSFSLAGGLLLNSPTLGANVLTNGSMEVGSPPSSWTALSNTTVTREADPRPGSAGSYALGVVSTTAATGAGVFQSVSLAQYAWYKFNAWVKNVNATGGLVTATGQSPSDSYFTANTPGSWEEHYLFVWASAASGWMTRLREATSPTPAIGNAARWDDVSLQPVTALTMGRLTRGGLQTVKIDFNLSDAANTSWAGVFQCGDREVDPSNCVMALAVRIRSLSSTNIFTYLVKVLNGVMSVERTGTVYVWEGLKSLEVRRTAETTFQLWYKDIQQGADVTISDAAIVGNKYAGTFLTGGSGNSIGAFFQL